MPDQMRLPASLRDAGFVRRLMALSRANSDPERHEILAVPLVADRVFEAYTHCPRGHLGEHDAGFPPVNHDGQAHVPRRCASPGCDASWLELQHGFEGVF